MPLRGSCPVPSLDRGDVRLWVYSWFKAKNKNDSLSMEHTIRLKATFSEQNYETQRDCRTVSCNHREPKNSLHTSKRRITYESLRAVENVPIIWITMAHKSISKNARLRGCPTIHGGQVNVTIVSQTSLRGYTPKSPIRRMPWQVKHGGPVIVRVIQNDPGDCDTHDTRDARKGV